MSIKPEKMSLPVFKALVKSGKPDKKYILLNKDIISYLLDDVNTNNRNINVARAQHLAEEIKRQGWFTFSPMSISYAGLLCDGQHRLRALRDLQYPEVPVMFNFGVTQAELMEIDSILARTIGQTIKMTRGDGVTPSAIMTGVVNHMLRYNPHALTYSWGHRIAKAKHIAKYEEVLKYAEEMPMLFATIPDNHLKGKGSTVKLISPAAHAVIQYRLLTDADFANDFLHRLWSQDENDPEYAAYRFIREKMRGGSKLEGITAHKTMVSIVLTHYHNMTNKKPKMYTFRPAKDWGKLAHKLPPPTPEK